MRETDDRNVEKQWWHHEDDLEPLMGVPSMAAAPAPLPDTASNEPEPGVAPEQDVEVADGFVEPDEEFEPAQ